MNPVANGSRRGNGDRILTRTEPSRSRAWLGREGSWSVLVLGQPPTLGAPAMTRMGHIRMEVSDHMIRFDLTPDHMRSYDS